MLSIGKVTPGRAAYYEQSVAKGRDDYYSGGGEAPGAWIGRGSRALGLTGRVEAERFNALIAGMDPSDPQLRRTLLSQERKVRVIGGKRHDPIAAYDLTFSAPKSVSVLFATADRATARELVLAHDHAVRAAVEYLEDRAVYTRRGRNGAVVEQGDGLIAAAYRHRMSRSKDPQLHTHVVAGNLVRTPSDGKWRALHASVVYRHARTAGVLYQAHLRAEIDERLGLEWGAVTKGAAELRDVPRPVLREFSRRRIEIERAAAADGLTLGTKASAEALALKTRQAKDLTVATADWRADIAARAQEHGLDHDTIEQLLTDGRDRLAHPTPARSDPDELAQHLTGPAGLTELQNTFNERDALTAIAEHHHQGLRIVDARAHASELLERDDVLPTRPGDEVTGVHDPRYSTTDLVASEHRLVQAAVERRGTDIAIVDHETIRAAVEAADRSPSVEQTVVIETVARSGNGVDVVEALAGTGKTFTAGIVRDVFARSGYHVIGTAPTGRAARELSEVGIPARTLDSLLLAAERNPQSAIPDRAVFILDEAGMAPTRRTERFLQLAEHAGAKVIAIGDSGQLPSVQAGGWLRQVGHATDAPTLRDVLRQRDPEERRVLGILHDRQGGGEVYLDWLDTHDRLHIALDGRALLTSAVADWATAAQTCGLENVALIARDHQTRSALNDLARRHRAALGALGEHRTYGTLRVATGDRVIARRNDPGIDVDNGTRGIVTALSPESVELRTDSGATRTLSSRYVAEHLEHAYALTGHGMQGATVEWAGVVARPEHLTKGWSYTALSRARDTTHLYIPAVDHERTEARAELAPHDSVAHPDRDRTKWTAAARMCVRDDEDLALDQLRNPQTSTPDRDTPTPYDRPTPPQRPSDHGAPSPNPPAERFLELHEKVEALQRRRDPDAERLLSQIDQVERRLATARQLADRAERRLHELPAPEHRLFRATRDPHSTERSTLTAKITTAHTQINELQHAHRAATHTLGTDPDRARAIHADAAADLRDTDRQRHQAREELISFVTKTAPPWTQELFGPPPGPDRDRAAWNDRLSSAVRMTLDADPSLASALGSSDFAPDSDHPVRTSIAEAVSTTRDLTNP